jgi:hypothetical protein
MPISGRIGMAVSSGRFESMDEKRKQPHFPCRRNLSVVRSWLLWRMTRGWMPRV